MDNDVAEKKSNHKLLVQACDDSRWARSIVDDLQSVLFEVEQSLENREEYDLAALLRIHELAVSKVKELLESTENATDELYERSKD